MKLSFIKLYNKATTIPEVYNKNRIQLYPCGS